MKRVSIVAPRRLHKGGAAAVGGVRVVAVAAAEGEAGAVAEAGEDRHVS